MIAAGTLTKRVTLEASTNTPDPYGEPGQTWGPVATVWAGIDPVSGREIELAKSYAPTVTLRVTIRYRPGGTPSMRVRYGDRLFYVNGVIDPHEAHEHLVLYCTEGGQ